MLLACNYSRELIQLLKEGRAQVDYIKLAMHEVCREGFEVSREFGPVLLHGIDPGVPERTGMTVEELERIDWERIEHLLTHYDSPHFGLHLDVTRQDWAQQRELQVEPAEILNEVRMSVGGEETFDGEAIIQHIIGIARSWASRIPVPMLLENVPYTEFYGTHAGTLEVVTRPEAIQHICAEANVDLLLDLSHARVTAWYRNEEITEYLAQLPLERIREIHVVSPRMTEQGMRDRHMELEEIDYATLEWLLQRTQPHVVTLEYGGVGPVYQFRSDLLTLERQLIRLMEICQRY